MTTRQKIILVLFLAFAVASAYLLAVGIVWLVWWLLSLGLGIEQHINVWLVGLLAWLIVGVYAGIKNVIKK